MSIPFDLIPLLRGPAPYPPEWQWAFRPEGPARPLVAAALVAAGLLVLLALSGGARARRNPAATFRVLIAGAVLLGWGFQLALLAREPGHLLRTLLTRTRSRSFTSYHAVAISPEARDPRVFLREHAERLPALAASAKHAGTHPPGPVLYYRSALALCESAPRLTDGLLAAAGVPDRAFRPPATRAARAAAILGALLLGFFGALTAWPLAHLARALGVESLAAGRLAVLWSLLPGAALMTPQFDQALSLPVVVATTLLLTAAHRPTKGSGLRRAALAGAIGGVAVFTSYGAAVFLAVGGAAALAAAHRTRTTHRGLTMIAGLATAVTGFMAFGIPALLGHEPVRAMLTALSVHRAMYTAPRSYALWLLFNPLDLALFLGVPVALAGTLRLAEMPGRVRERNLIPTDRFRLATWGGVALLVVLGVTRGEVGRIWIPLMPLLLLSSLAEPEAPDGKEAVFVGTLIAVLTLVIGSYWVV